MKIKVPNIIIDPVGLDIPIQSFQDFLNTELKNEWGVSDYLSFGKATTIKGTPTVYFKDGEYLSVFACDKYSAMSFFQQTGQAAAIEENTQERFTTNVDLIFFVNVKKIKKTLKHYPSEEIKQDIINAINKHQQGWTIKNLITGEDVYSGYEYKNKERINVHPYFVLKIELETEYRYNNYICIK